MRSRVSDPGASIMMRKAHLEDEEEDLCQRIVAAEGLPLLSSSPCQLAGSPSMTCSVTKIIQALRIVMDLAPRFMSLAYRSLHTRWQSVRPAVFELFKIWGSRKPLDWML